MTPEERASKIVHNVDIGWLEDEIIFAIKEAVKFETEACAKIAEELFNGFGSPYEYKEDVQEAIRNRSK